MEWKPVIRALDTGEENILSRLGGQYSISGMYHFRSMVQRQAVLVVVFYVSS
jgi:hypothetical protein